MQRICFLCIFLWQKIGTRTCIKFRTNKPFIIFVISNLCDMESEENSPEKSTFLLNPPWSWGEMPVIGLGLVKYTMCTYIMWILTFHQAHMAAVHPRVHFDLERHGLRLEWRITYLGGERWRGSVLLFAQGVQDCYVPSHKRIPGREEYAINREIRRTWGRKEKKRRVWERKRQERES